MKKIKKFNENFNKEKYDVEFWDYNVNVEKILSEISKSCINEWRYFYVVESGGDDYAVVYSNEILDEEIVQSYYDEWMEQ